jgi:hypothetical protein
MKAYGGVDVCMGSSYIVLITVRHPFSPSAVTATASLFFAMLLL